MDIKTINYVIYHANCSDGFASAWAAWKLLGNHAEYHAAKHGHPAPTVSGRRVAVLDFAYDKKTMQRLMQDAEFLIMRDHHKSAMMMLDQLSGIKTDFFDLSHSGCVLAWELFHPGIEVPKFLRFIENRDMGWKPFMEYAKEFSMAFDMTPFDFKSYDKMLNSSYVDDCISRGSHILPYAETVIEKACQNAVKKKLLGYDVLVVNATNWVSEIGMRLAPDCDFALVWFWDHNDKLARISLRSFHSDIDCGNVARKLGGGGHADIAGFEYPGNIEELFNGRREQEETVMGCDMDEDGSRVGQEVDRSPEPSGLPGSEFKEHTGPSPGVQRRSKRRTKPGQE